MIAWTVDGMYHGCSTPEEVKEHIKDLLDKGIPKKDIRIFSPKEKAEIDSDREEW